MPPPLVAYGNPPHSVSLRVVHPKAKGSQVMKTTITYWKEPDGRYLGYLNSHPEHWTQRDTLEDLKEYLRDLYDMFSGEEIPRIKKVAELEML